jgi:hypothetical protein
VSWYLMVPPPNSSGSNSFEGYPPLSEWSVYKKYDSADDCEQFRLNIAAGLLQDPPPDFLRRFGDSFIDVFEQARCIASDDPRLRKK